jgi:hypothetical protein
MVSLDKLRCLYPTADPVLFGLADKGDGNGPFIDKWQQDFPQPSQAKIDSVKQSETEALKLSDDQQSARDQRWAAYRAQGGPDDMRMKLTAQRDPDVDAKVEAARQTIQAEIPIS